MTWPVSSAYCLMSMACRFHLPPQHFRDSVIRLSRAGSVGGRSLGRSSALVIEGYVEWSLPESNRPSGYPSAGLATARWKVHAVARLTLSDHECYA